MSLLRTGEAVAEAGQAVSGERAEDGGQRSRAQRDCHGIGGVLQK